MLDSGAIALWRTVRMDPHGFRRWSLVPAPTHDATISLNLRTNLYLGTKEKSAEILHLLETRDDIFLPEKFDIEMERDRPKRVPFRQNMDLAVRILTQDEPGPFVAERRHPVRVDFDIAPSRWDFFDRVEISIDQEWLRDPGHLEKFIALAKDLYLAVEASHGYMRNDGVEAPHDRIEGYRGGTFYSEPRFPGVYNYLRGLFWANLFGPEYVRMWGREYLLRSPCRRTEELPDGGIALCLAESPLEAADPRYQEAKQRLYEYLGYEAFEGRRYPEFRTSGRWRKKRRARPLVQTGGILDDVFSEEPP